MQFYKRQRPYLRIHKGKRWSSPGGHTCPCYRLSGNFKQELVEQVKLDTIGQHPLLKETLIEELQPLKQGFIELRRSITKTLIKQRQFLREMSFQATFIEQRRSPREGVELTAWIDIGNGGALRECVVLVADKGTRVKMSSSQITANSICYLTRRARENAAGCSGAPMKRSA